MIKTKLVEVLKSTTVEERDAIEQIIINGEMASICFSMENLRLLGLVYFSNSSLTWVYDGGPISEFFEVVQ